MRLLRFSGWLLQSSVVAKMFWMVDTEVFNSCKCFWTVAKELLCRCWGFLGSC